MNDNPIQTFANRLGFMAYMFVMSGGRPDWSGLFGQAGLDSLESREHELESPHPLRDTVPVEVLQDRERAATSGY